MIRNPYNPEIQAFIPLKIGGMTTNAFLTENKKALEKELENNPPEIIPYKLGAVSFNVVKEPKLSFYHRMAIQMGQTAVTQELFQAVMGWEDSLFEGNPQNPVTKNINWFDCVSFCNRLSELLELQPCYKITDVEMENGSINGISLEKSIKSAKVVWKEGANGFRLPIALEWQHFAKAGTNNTWSGTNDEAELVNYAWYDKNSGGRIHPVGELSPNEWGLYDMSGNVPEWCWNMFWEVLLPGEIPKDRLILGGGFYSRCKDLSLLRGDHELPDYRGGVGFRICRNF